MSGESDTTNNCSSAVAVTVGAAPAPDLVVDTPTVSTSAPTAGGSFTLNATVRNQGNGSAGSTTLRYYRSTDSTITTGDNAVGTDSVSPLNASESGDESISLDAPSTPGTYFYGACVDSVSDESDTTNNCSSAVSVTVAEAPAPDLVVDTPTVSNYAPAAGASFTMDATVRNLGTGASGSTTLRYYQSADSTVTAADTEVGTDSVSRLNASASGDESISLTAPDTAGTYYYGACVDSVSNESNNTNNCSGAVTVTVGAGAQQTSTCATGAAVSDAANNPGLVADCDALLAAKEQLEGTVPLNWSADTPIFDWDGIISLYGRGRITWIALEKDLDGTIPAELGDLTELTTLSLSNNQLTGAIPPELGDLSKLTKLNLSNNRLSGAIPSNLGRLNSLKSLSLSQNELSGAIPAELAGLSELQTLRLRENQLTESIPSALGRLAKLSSLVLSNNQLTGTIPSELGNLSLLYSLSASDNQLTGSLPSSLGRLSKLNRLDFANNRLTGSFPPELGNLGNLELLYLYANKLSGDVPSELGDLTKLDGLFLYGNQLTGCVPEHLEAQLDRSTLWAVGVTFCDDSTTPGAPTGLTATADGQTEIDLSWRAPSDDGGANITGYRIEVSTDGSNWSDLEANTRSTSTSYSHTGLTAGSTRHYRVSAINSVGTGPASNVDDATTESAPVATAPGAPTGLTATADGQTEIDLSWRAPSDDGGVDITGYRIEVSTNSSNWSDLESNTDSTSTSYSHTGLTAGSTRHYRVSAINSVGTGRASDTDSATTDSAPNPDPTPSPATKAVTGSITSCEGEQVAPGIDSYRITIEGTVTANRAVENVTVEGTLNGDFVGIDIVGDMAAGETAYFTITGYVSESVGECGAHVEWLEIN